MPKQEPKARSVLNLKIAIVAAAAAGAMLAAPQIADACTRILWNNNKLAVVVGRTMDWPESTQPILTMLPRGMSRDGGRAGPQVAVPDNPARWTSRYAKPGHLDLRHRHRRRVERARPRRTHAVSAGDRFRPARPQQAGPASRPVGAICLGQRGDRAGGARCARQGPGRQGDRRTATRPMSIWRWKTQAAIPPSSNISAAGRSFITAAITGS